LNLRHQSQAKTETSIGVQIFTLGNEHYTLLNNPLAPTEKGFVFTPGSMTLIDGKTGANVQPA